MDCRPLEVIIDSASGLKDVDLFSNMDVYAVVSVAGDPRNTEQKTKTPVVKDGGTNPIKFTVDEAALLHNRLTLNVELVSERNLELVSEDTKIGKVKIPLKELLDSMGGGDAQKKQIKHVSYSVESSRGEHKGTINFGYKFGDKISVPEPQKKSHEPGSSLPIPACRCVPTTGYKFGDKISVPEPQKKSHEPGSSSGYPPVAHVGAYPPAQAYPYPPAGKYPPLPYQQPGYGYAPPPQVGYPPTQPYPYPPAGTYPSLPYQQPGYGYTPPPQARYPPAQAYPYPPAGAYLPPPYQQPGYGYAPPPQAGYGYRPQPRYGYPPQQVSAFMGGLFIGDMISGVGEMMAGFGGDGGEMAGYNAGFGGDGGEMAGYNAGFGGDVGDVAGHDAGYDAGYNAGFGGDVGDVAGYDAGSGGDDFGGGFDF